MDDSQKSCVVGKIDWAVAPSRKARIGTDGDGMLVKTAIETENFLKRCGDYK